MQAYIFMMITISFIAFLLLFASIGLFSITQRKQKQSDYLLASKSIKPWLVGLSAVATANSGYMFVGMIGYTYHIGLSAIWLALGWVVGDFIASTFIHTHLRKHTEQTNSLSYGELLACLYETPYKKLQKLIAVITFVFLSIYAAAQLSAGSKALFVLFNWPYELGAILGAIIVVLYCFAGGIRASIWTDVAQSIVMFVSMLSMVVVGIMALKGPSTTLSLLHQVSPEYMQWFPNHLQFGVLGPLLFAISWFFAGFGVVGQPHIMVRFMTIDHVDNIYKARIYYYIWYTLFFAMTITTGLLTRLLIEQTQFDAELALPMLAQQLLPTVFVGLTLAGLFGATMSTADSQIISCTAAVGRDLLKTEPGYRGLKWITLLITLFALTISLYGSKSVFVLVMYAWAVLCAAFTPLLTLQALRKPISERLAIIMVAVGTLVAIIWDLTPFSQTIYSAMPGMLAGFGVYILRLKARR